VTAVGVSKNPETDPSPVKISVLFIPPTVSVNSRALPAELTLTYLLAVKLPGVSLNPTKVDEPPPPPPPSNTEPLWNIVPEISTSPTTCNFLLAKLELVPTFNP
jgi:hypothetical protein